MDVEETKFHWAELTVPAATTAEVPVNVHPLVLTVNPVAEPMLIQVRLAMATVMGLLVSVKEAEESVDVVAATMRGTFSNDVPAGSESKVT